MYYNPFENGQIERDLEKNRKSSKYAFIYFTTLTTLCGLLLGTAFKQIYRGNHPQSVAIEQSAENTKPKSRSRQDHSGSYPLYGGLAGLVIGLSLGRLVNNGKRIEGEAEIYYRYSMWGIIPEDRIPKDFISLVRELRSIHEEEERKASREDRMGLS